MEAQQMMDVDPKASQVQQVNRDTQKAIDRISGRYEFTYRPSSEITDVMWNSFAAFLMLNCGFPLGRGEKHIFYIYDNQKQKIVALLELIWDQPNRIELYSVCTGIEYRRKGWAQTLVARTLEVVVNNYPDAIVWLGVERNNIKVAELYAKIGFAYPYLTEQTPYTGSYRYPLIGMYYSRAIARDHPPVDYTFNKAQRLAEILTHLEDSRVEGLFISAEDIEFLFAQMWIQPVEIFGNFSIRGRDHLVLNRDSIVLGDATGVVPERFSVVDFHTHPYAAYTAVQVFVNSPSHNDIVAHLSVSHEERAHLVFALEGIYLGVFDTMLVYKVQFRMNHIYQ